jgi:hypothetical protein
MKAFPDSHMCNNEGMDLRDYFAAKAMPLAIDRLSQNFQRNFGDDWGFDAEDSITISEIAYEIADEMMKQRKL